MICHECQGNYAEKTGKYTLDDPYFGAVSAQGKYYECDKCGDVLLTPEISEALDSARDNLKQELLKKRPLGDFLSAAETASFLGISRQALNKNRRIRHGFIFQTAIGGFTVYLRQSVILYKEKGDGRFNLRDEAGTNSDAVARVTNRRTLTIAA